MFNRETQKNWMKSQVAHSLRGRLRLRVEGLNFLNDEKEEIAQMLAKLPGVQCVQVTPITCGILLRFDPTATDTSILCEGVDVTMARYAMNAYRTRQAGSRPEEPEVSMTTKQLTKRLALNAGAAIYVAGLAGSIKDGVARAQEAIASGAARDKLDALIRLSWRFG